MPAIPMASLASLWLVPDGLGIGVASKRGTEAEVRWGQCLIGIAYEIAGSHAPEEIVSAAM